jgi:magnesium chelatase family protein
MVRQRVMRARAIQKARHEAREVSAPVNAQLSAKDIEAIARPDAAGLRLIGSAVERLGLSARAYGKILRVARTLADLEGATAVSATHVAEAVQARIFDRHLQPTSAVSPSHF